jgi:hypothetical protein
MIFTNINETFSYIEYAEWLINLRLLCIIILMYIIILQD